MAPREFSGPAPRGRKGLLIIYTGNGKGKTTAAFGAALRTLGRGHRVAVVQFIKGQWLSGELNALKKFGNQIELYPLGDGFTWNTKNWDNDVASAQKGWKKCTDLLAAHKHDLYIFDELLYVLKYRFLSVKEVTRGLSLKSRDSHVILTGRGAPRALLSMADLVTEMKEIKHPYKKGITAQPGIDF